MKLGAALAPHDVRRTFAKLAHKGRAPLEQIQIALGHACFRRPNATWEWNRTSLMRPATTLASGRAGRADLKHRRTAGPSLTRVIAR